MKNQIKIICLLLFTIASFNSLTAKGKFKTEAFKVSGNCNMCKQNIEASVKVAGVEAALWNPDSKLLRVKYDPTQISIEKIHEYVAAAGYDTDKLKANDSAYFNLAKCCQYRTNSCSHDK